MMTVGNPEMYDHEIDDEVQEDLNEISELLDDIKNIENINMKTEIINNKPKYYYKILKGISNIKGGVHVLKDLKYPEIITNSAFKVLDQI